MTLLRRTPSSSAFSFSEVCVRVPGDRVDLANGSTAVSEYTPSLSLKGET